MPVLSVLLILFDYLSFTQLSGWHRALSASVVPGSFIHSFSYCPWFKNSRSVSYAGSVSFSETEASAFSVSAGAGLFAFL